MEKRNVWTFSNFSLLFILLFMTSNDVNAIKWLGLREEKLLPGPNRCSIAREAGIFPCAALPHVAQAAKLTIEACKETFVHNRWNCSSVDKAPNFGPDLLLGTKEQSFVYALSSATLMYAMARACSSGVLFSCTCGQPPRERPNGNFKWGGCSDNLKWAGRFVRQFIEVPERLEGHRKSPAPNKGEKEVRIYDTTGRRVDAEGNPIDPAPIIDKSVEINENIGAKLSINHRKEHLVVLEEELMVTERSDNGNLTTASNSQVGGLARIDEIANEATLVRRDVTGKKKKRFKEGGRSSKRRKKMNRKKMGLEEKLEKLQPYIALANLQNSRAGRKLAERSLSIQCKCHGVSGSCSIRTCWRALQPPTMLAAKLAVRLAAAAIVPRSHTPRRSATKAPQALVYVTASPNYCYRDESTGSLGTSGRWCNGTSRLGEASCRHLCCGRGYKTLLSEKLERCNCRYIWCCKVECDVCKTITETNYCN